MGSRFAARHDVYALTDRLVTAKGQVMVETNIVLGLPEGTYQRRASRTGIASKMGIPVGSRVIDADYTGEVKVILQNHGQADCLYKATDLIAQLIVERIADADAIEVDDVGTTELGKKDFGSSLYLNPKLSITAKEEGIKISFLHAERGDTEFFSATDISYRPRLIRERDMLSSTHVNPTLTRTINHLFLDKIRVAGKEDEKWQERDYEPVRLRESCKQMSNE